MISEIICDNCLNTLSHIEEKSIDLILTDPPYNIGLKYNSYKDKKSKKEFWNFIEQVFKELFRILRDKRHLIFTCSQKQIWVYKPLLEQIGFQFRHLGIWHNPKRKAGSYPGQWPYSWEAILDFTKNGFRKLNNKNSVGYMDIWIEEPPKNIKHPTKRPITCWNDLLKLTTLENEIVLDPFLGSGTTAIVAYKNKRNFIGIEIDPDYCKLTQERLQQQQESLKTNC